MDTKATISGRRSVLSNGAAWLGAGFIPQAVARSVGSEAHATGAMPVSVYNVKDFGATGERAANATQAFRQAIETCTGQGGGVVYVPPGEYTVGTVQLRDHVTLHLEAGATLFLSQDREDFIPGGRAMIFANNAKNIAVTGRGTLNGLARYDYTEMRDVDGRIAKEIELAREAGVDMRRYYRSREATNTYMFIINDSTDFLLEGVSILNSPLWTVRLNDCDRVFVRGVYLYSDLEKGVNADGIDICSCSNVTISNSVIKTADDSICIKAVSRNEKPARPCRNITVTNCVLTSSSTPLKIGTETVETEISHVLFHNCVIRNSNKGFGIDVLDGATVSDIVFSNLTIETNRRHWNWWGSAEMCKIVLGRRNASSKLGTIRNIIIDNISAEVMGTSKIAGHPDRPLENIRISNVHMAMRPEDYKDKRSTHAFVIEEVAGLAIRDMTIRWTEDATEKKWQSALALSRVSDFVIDSFSGRQGLLTGNDPAILMEDVSGGVVRHSYAPAGTHAFLHLKGDSSKEIRLKSNRLSKADKVITFEHSSLENVVQLK
jgi:hypothetical protein